MIKKETAYNDIYNYRNSKYFINTVAEARKWEPSHEKLVIFAGACQSFYEALMSAGANFASSPARILIDFADPLIVAERVATTDKFHYLTIDDISYELRDGKKGVGGTGAKGKKEIMYV
ncbi:MAG: sporulation peptidase YabG [Clostridia bacterium]